ncbi:MAG: PilZ domain-containing protein [Oligoflexus sp.]
MSEIIRYFSSLIRRLAGLKPIGFKELMAARGHFGTRAFHRHGMNFPKAGYLEFGDKKLALLNLSSGGVCIQAEAHLFMNLFKAGGRFRARLTVIGFSRTLTFSVAYTHASQVGLRFEDLQRADQQFLDLSLGFLDYGLILQSLNKQQVPKAYQSPNWNSYGLLDHDVVVHLNMNLQGALEETHVSYANGFRKEMVVFDKHAIHVVVFPGKKLSVFDKKRILRNALLIIIGLRQVSDTDRFDRLLASGIVRLFKKESPKHVA